MGNFAENLNLGNRFRPPACVKSFNSAAAAHRTVTDLKTWMAGSAEKLMQSGRHIGSVKKPS